MHTDADGNMVFRSLKGNLYYCTLTILLSASVLLILLAAYGLLNGPFPIIITCIFILVPVILMLLFSALFIAVVNSMRFVLGRDGIEVPNSVLIAGVRNQGYIPYSAITKFYGTTRILAPAFSTVSSSDAVIIVFTNINGRRGDMVAVSPEEKALFISELAKRTGINASDDPHAYRKNTRK